MEISEKSVRHFTKLIYRHKINFWNLYNPVTGELLKSTDLKKRKELYFKNRPDSWDQCGVLDLCGVDTDHNLLWLKRVEKYFNNGFYLCSLNKNPADRVLSDLLNIGFSLDEEGKVISSFEF